MQTQAPMPTQGLEARARLLPLPGGFYEFALVPSGLAAGIPEGSALPAVAIRAAPDSPELDIVDLSGRDGCWLMRSQRLFAVAPTTGTVVVLTGYRSRRGPPVSIDVEVRRLDRAAAAGAGDAAAIAEGSLFLGLMSDTGSAVTIEAVAALRGEGESRFVDTDWIGGLGRGRWIESFAIWLRGALPATAIEYKALTAGGEETAWIGGGEVCGVPGRKAPLIGFALRQRPASGAPLFDCEYNGVFQSGAASGPVRNGAPCLSGTPNDPIEGLRVRLVPRPPRGETSTSPLSTTVC